MCIQELGECARKGVASARHAGKQGCAGMKTLLDCTSLAELQSAVTQVAIKVLSLAGTTGDPRAGSKAVPALLHLALA